MKNNIPNMKALHFAPILLSFLVLILFNIKTCAEGLEFCFDGSKEGEQQGL
jgi:hypothetical protein